MRAPARTITLITLLLLSVLLPFGCIVKTVKTVGISTGSVTVGSREVKYSVEDSVGAFANSKSATIAFAAGEVVIETDRALLDGKEVAKLPDDAKVVLVKFAGGTLSIAADGKTLHEVKLVK